MKVYDLAIVGTGVAGAAAAALAAEAGLDVLVLEKGQGPKERRSLVSGWLGRSLYSMTRIDAGRDNFTDQGAFDAALDCCRAANGGRLEQRQAWEVLPSDLPLRASGGMFYQAGPCCGRELSQSLYQRLTAFEESNILFNTSVERLEHADGQFVIHTNRARFLARKCLLATGARSVEWIGGICRSLGLAARQPDTRLGIRVEVPSKLLRAFLQVVGDLRLETDTALLDDMRAGSMIGDRDDGGLLTVFAYSMPGRQVERTSFMASVAGSDFAETARLVRIINTLSNDKVRRERAVDFTHGHSVLEHLDQFDPVRKALLDLDRMLPSFLGCAAIHLPEMRVGGTLPVDTDMRTAFGGLYGAGECASRVASPLGALASAIVATRNIVEEING